MANAELTQDLYEKLQEVKQHYTTVQEKFVAMVRTQKPLKRIRHRAQVALKNVRFGIANSERQLQQIDDSPNMRPSTIDKHLHEIEQAITSYTRLLKTVEDYHLSDEQDDEKKSAEQKPEPEPIPPSSYSE